MKKLILILSLLSLTSCGIELYGTYPPSPYYYYSPFYPNYYYYRPYYNPHYHSRPTPHHHNGPRHK